MYKRRNRFFRSLLFFVCLFMSALIVYRLWMYAESARFFRLMREATDLTDEEAGMEGDEAGMTGEETGVTDEETGMTDEEAELKDDATEWADGERPDPCAESSGRGWPADALFPDWDVLADMHVSAWLRFGSISYPVMQGKDNSYYLHRLPDGRANAGGSLFLLAENDKGFHDRNSIIYGHNMADGSMFGELKRLKKKSTSANYFDLYLPDCTLHRYALFAVLCVQADADAFTIGFPDAQDYVLWQREMKKLSVRACAAPVTGTRRMVTLVTCDGPAGTSRRLAVIGEEMRVWKQPHRQRRGKATEAAASAEEG